MEQEKELWYASWFDTPYYHILYKDRDYKEAGLFMNNLTSRLGLEKGATILDLACGKGRHSKFLNELGYDVTGVDLSPQSIAFASQYENDTLHFKVHDMCKPLDSRFDAVFNLFTSFGYFETEQDNIHTITAIKEELKEKGRGVIDFLNSDLVIKNLVKEEVKTIDGITFYLKRYVEDGHIFKEIKFNDQNTDFSFTEKVKALTLADFEDYINIAGAQIDDVYGDYQLNPFDIDSSPRLILVFS